MPGRQISYFVFSGALAAGRATKWSTIVLGTEPHACIAIARGTRATDFSWSKWLAAWIAGACAQ